MDSGERMTLVGPMLITGVVAVLAWAYKPLDWTTAHTAGRAVIGGDLRVYSHHPEAQMGPLALVVASLPRPVFAALVCALLGVVLVAARRLGATVNQVFVGGMLAAIPWAFFALEGHADDALVLVGAAVMAVGARHRRGHLIGGGFVLAIAAKPTAVILAPLLLLAAWPVIAVALFGAVIVWLPFVLPDVGAFLAAGHGIALVRTWSLPNMLGADAYSGFPAWVRPAQFIGGMVICTWFVRRHRFAEAMLAAMAFRVMLEPGAAPSYSTSLIVLALLLPSRQVAVGSLAAASWVVSYLYPLNAVEGIMRLTLLVAVVIVAHGSLVVPARTSGGWPGETGLAARAGQVTPETRRMNS